MENCHFCHDMEHWIGDCPEAQKLREQQMSTDRKPTYGQCYICGHEDHWAPNCPKREEDLMNDEESQPKLVDYSDSESSDDEDNIRPPQRKRRAMVIYSGDEDEELTSQQSSESTEKQQIESSVLREDVWILVQRRQLTVRREGRKVSNGAKIRNRYNQVPHLTQDTNGKVTNSQKTPQTRAKRSALSQQVTTKHK